MKTDPSLFYVVKCFPDHKQVIYRLFKKDENFKILCEDYRLCYEALERWKQSESEKAPARRKEYKDLLQELEEEVSQSLSNLYEEKSS